MLECTVVYIVCTQTLPFPHRGTHKCVKLSNYCKQNMYFGVTDAKAVFILPLPPNGKSMVQHILAVLGCTHKYVMGRLLAPCQGLPTFIKEDGGTQSTGTEHLRPPVEFRVTLTSRSISTPLGNLFKPLPLWFPSTKPNKLEHSAET